MLKFAAFAWRYAPGCWQGDGGAPWGKGIASRPQRRPPPHQARALRQQHRPPRSPRPPPPPAPMSPSGPKRRKTAPATIHQYARRQHKHPTTKRGKRSDATGTCPDTATNAHLDHLARSAVPPNSGESRCRVFVSFVRGAAVAARHRPLSMVLSLVALGGMPFPCASSLRRRLAWLSRRRAVGAWPAGRGFVGSGRGGGTAKDAPWPIPARPIPPQPPQPPPTQTSPLPPLPPEFILARPPMPRHLSRAAVIALCLLVLCLSLPAANALRVAVIPGVTYSHFSPAAKIVEKLEQRGHECVLFVPPFAHRQCQNYFRGSHMCAVLKSPAGTSFDRESLELGGTEVFQLNMSSSQDYNRFLIDALLGSARLQTFAPDVFVADFGSFGADAVANALDRPTVFLWWHQSLFPTDLTPSVPRLGSGRPRNMPYFAKVPNWLEKVVRNIRFNGKKERAALKGLWAPAHVPAPPPSHLVTRRHIITPGFLGLDLSIPTCPNVHRVGFVHSESDHQLSTLPSGWKEWSDGCLYGIIYMNAADEVASTALQRALAEVSERFGTCVVWRKSTDADDDVLQTHLSPRIRITHYLPFSPRRLLSHRYTKLVITQCGQSMVQEAIDTETAILCMTTDNSDKDLLQRVEEGLLGDVVDAEADKEELVSSVLYLFNNSRVFEAIRRVKRMGYLLGGTQRAAEVVELAALLGRSDQSFFCRTRNFTVAQLVGCLLASFTATVCFLLIASRIRRNRHHKTKID